MLKGQRRSCISPFDTGTALIFHHRTIEILRVFECHVVAAMIVTVMVAVVVEEVSVVYRSSGSSWN